jgi:hypothetical protein
MHRVLQPALSVVVFLSSCSALRAEPEEFNTQMMRATVKVSGERSTATAFILSRPAPGEDKSDQFVLITAGHVFETMVGNEATVFVRKKQADGTYKKMPTKIRIRMDSKPVWVKHPSADVAVMPLVPPQDADLPALPVDLLATDELLKKYGIHPGDDLSSLGYPHQIEANEAGFAVLRRGAIASFPLTPTKSPGTFLLSANTFEGDSGGPVYLADPNRKVPGKDTPQDVHLILGLVTGQHFLDEDVKTVYGSSKTRHRLGLGIVVHASLIREAIDRLP